VSKPKEGSGARKRGRGAGLSGKAIKKENSNVALGGSGGAVGWKGRG